MSPALYYIIIFVTFLFSLAITKPINHPAAIASGQFETPKNEISTPTADSPAIDIPTDIDFQPNGPQVPRKQKRASREIRECPNGYGWISSECRNNLAPQRYINRCSWDHLPTNPPKTLRLIHSFPGYCRPGEFCVNTGAGENKLAFCITQGDLVNWIITETSPEDLVIPASQVGLPSTSKGDSQYALDAFLTGSNTLQTINATSLRIQAQQQVNVHGNFLTQTLPGGMVECDNCASITLDPVPDGTQSVAVDLVLEEVGNLFLGSIML